MASRTNAARVVGHVNIKAVLHVRVPLLRDGRDVQFSREQSPFYIISQEHVERIRELVRLDASGDELWGDDWPHHGPSPSQPYSFYLMEHGQITASFPASELEQRMEELHEVIGV